jgi:hypothetical protein
MASWEEHFTASGISRLSLPTDEASSYFTDWLSDAGWRHASSAGGSLGSADKVGSALNLSGTGNAHSQMMNGNAGAHFVVAPLNGSSGRTWYLAARLAKVTPATATANTFMMVGLRNGAAGSTVLRAGINGSISTTHFIVQISGGTNRTSSTSIIQTGFFDLELWCDGTNVGLSINEGTAETWSVSGASSNFGAIELYAQESAGGGTVSCLFDKTLMVTPQPT